MGISNIKLIDELDQCKRILSGKERISPPYTKKLIFKKAKAILHILIKERELDMDLMRAQYKWLMEEIEKELKRS